MPFEAERESNNPESSSPEDGEMRREKKKQEKALALSQRQGSHFRPQCGRLRGTGAGAFTGSRNDG